MLEISAAPLINRILSSSVDAATLQNIEAQTIPAIRAEQQNILEGEAFLQPEPAQKELNLRAQQAVLRALLHRQLLNAHALELPTTFSGRAEASGVTLYRQKRADADVGDREDKARPVGGQTLRKLIDELDMMIKGYRVLSLLKELELDGSHTVEKVQRRLGRELEKGPFAPVWEEVEEQIFRGQLVVGQGWLGRWWEGLPAGNEELLSLEQVIWLPLLACRKGRDVGQASSLWGLVLYVVADVAWMQLGEMDGEGRTLEDVCTIFDAIRAELGVERREGMVALAWWAAEQEVEGVDRLIIELGGERGLGSAVYRHLLWFLACRHRWEEVAHALSAHFFRLPTYLDACLYVGTLLELGRWEEAFHLQRDLAMRPAMLALPQHTRLLPLSLLTHRLLSAHRLHHLVSLPLTPLEHQHIFTYIHSSRIYTRDYTCLALLFTRRQYSRAWAYYQLIQEDLSEITQDTPILRRDIHLLVTSTENFIPIEELQAMRALVEQGDRVGLERFAGLGEVAREDGVDGEGEGRRGDVERGTDRSMPGAWFEAGERRLVAEEMRAMLLPPLGKGGLKRRVRQEGGRQYGSPGRRSGARRRSSGERSGGLRPRWSVTRGEAMLVAD